MWHSERNGSATEPMRFLQFWILPDTPNLEPSVQQQSFTEEERRNRLLRVAGPRAGRPGSDPPGRFGARRVDRSEHRGHALARRGARSLRLPHSGRRPVRRGARSRRVLRPGSSTSRRSAFAPTKPSELILVDLPMRWTPVGVWAGVSRPLVRSRARTGQGSRSPSVRHRTPTRMAAADEADDEPGRLAAGTRPGVAEGVGPSVLGGRLAGPMAPASRAGHQHGVVAELGGVGRVQVHKAAVVGGHPCPRWCR